MRIGGWTCGGQSTSSPGSLLKNEGKRGPGNEATKELVQMVLGKLAMMLGWRIAGLDCTLYVARCTLHVARCGMCSISICT